MLVKVMVLAVLLFAVTRSGRPLLWAAIYAVAVATSGLMGGHPTTDVLPSALIAGALALVYFLLLDRTGNVLLWWLVLMGGLVVMLAIA